MNDTYQSSNNPGQKNPGDCKYPERDNATQHTINSERKKICNDLYISAGKTSMYEKRFQGENTVYELKKCLFTKTEANYQRYRNLDMCVGAELTQTNESVKSNVAAYIKLNKDLGEKLKGIAASIKNVKAKFAELHDASCKLESCLTDSCNSSQRKAITGNAPGCTGEPPEICKDSETIFHELICRPKGLLKDIDSIFKASYDVVGIQKFSNIDSLETMQGKLSENAKGFGDQISSVMKSRKTDLDNLQGEMVKSVQEITKAAITRNFERSNFEGYKDAAGFVCCPPCECVVIPSASDSGGDMKKLCEQLGKPMLETCEKDICKICEVVQQAFCCPEKTPEPQSKPGC